METKGKQGERLADTKVFVGCVMKGIPATDQKLEKIRAALVLDDVSQTVMDYCMNGWPAVERRAEKILARSRSINS